MRKVAVPPKALLVLADGAQTAFAAGAVAELARSGVSWRHGAGAGLGAQVAVLALLGEAEEAERRWRREAELGCPLFASRLAAVRQTLGASPGLTIVPDALSLPGWLEPAGLDEHLAPEMAAVPERLANAGAACAVAVEDLLAGRADWIDLTGLTASHAGEALRAAATFPAGWGAQGEGDEGTASRRWGGIGAAVAAGPPWQARDEGWDVVCGFPFPATTRPALGESLFELVQRREESLAAAALQNWLGREDCPPVRVIAPAPEAYRSWAVRENADLGVEYPLPWERNGEVMALILRFGVDSAARVISQPGP